MTTKRVSIDDEITRIGPKSVTLQTVERVDRDCFYTSDSSVALVYTDEGVTWIRGHHVLRSTEVQAAQAALALVAEKQAATGSVEQLTVGLGMGIVPRKAYEQMIELQRQRDQEADEYRLQPDPRPWSRFPGIGGERKKH